QVVDVDAHAVPLDDTARVVAQRLCAALDPPVGTVGSALTISPDEGRARLEGACQRPVHRAPVIGMNDGQGSRAVGRDQILQSDAGDARGALVEVARYSFGRRAPYKSRHGVDHLLKLVLALPERLLGVHLVVYVVT